LFRITARTVELGSELTRPGIIAFYELIKNGFDAKTKNGVDIRFDIALPRRAYLKLQESLSEGGQLSDLKTEATEAILTTASPEAQAGFVEVTQVSGYYCATSFLPTERGGNADPPSA
jgi:hypothetical protein